MTQAMTTTTNTTKRNRIVAFFLAFLMILAGIGGTTAVTAQEANAASNHYHVDSVTHRGNGVSVCPYDVRYENGRLVMECSIQNRTGRPVTLTKYQVSVNNGSQVIASTTFNMNKYLEPGKMYHHTFKFSSEHCIKNANLNNIGTNYNCSYINH